MVRLEKVQKFPPLRVLDPIDGTTNFVHSNPNICTILAFMVDKVNLFLYICFGIFDYILNNFQKNVVVPDWYVGEHTGK